MTLIRSASNPRIKYLRSLYTQRKARKANREFVVEGVQAISAAYAHGWRVKQLIYAPDSVRSDWAKKTLKESDPRTHLQVASELLNRLSERDDTELIAVVLQSEDNLARIQITSDWLVLVVEQPQNSGNLGTIIRTSDALGAHGVVIVEPAVDLYDPKTVRATMGSLFALPVVRVGAIETLQEWLVKVRATLGNLQVAATSPYGAVPIYRHDFRRPTLIIIGNEQTGVSEEVKAMCVALASIPMYGAAESLNSAVSAAIVLYEAKRQRVV